jgi:hypothetical protein
LCYEKAAFDVLTFTASGEPIILIETKAFNEKLFYLPGDRAVV